MRERRPHVIRVSKQMTAQTRFLFVDTETSTGDDLLISSGDHSLRLGWTISIHYENQKSNRIVKDEEKYFETSDQFFDILESNLATKKPLWVIAHNWNFDGCILKIIETLNERGYEIVSYINSGTPPVIIKAQKENKTVEFIDSMNWFRSSLASIGSSLGEPKQPTPDTYEDLEAVKSYCLADTRIIQKAIHSLRKLILNEDLGSMKKTIASQALNTFLTTSYDVDSTPIYVHDVADTLQDERRAYKGGRTDAFYRGWVYETLYKLDVNSFYPAIMVDERLATKYLYTIEETEMNWDTLERIVSDERLTCIADVEIDTNVDAYGVKDKNLGLIFPIGQFRTILARPELEYAIENNHLRDIYKIHVYEAHNIFAGYVSKLWELRQRYKHNKDFYWLIKILMNSLYGKFGQRGRYWETYRGSLDVGFHELWDGTLIIIREIAGIRQQLITMHESYHSCPIIAAEITAHSRIRLQRYYDQTGGRVYYSDTDSLIVDAEGLERLSPHIGDNIGQLKLEETSDLSAFWAPKHYYFNGNDIIKGIKKNAQLTPLGYRQTKFESWGKRIRNNEPEGTILIEDVYKRVSGKNKKRIGNEGWLLPINLLENGP